MSDTPTLFSKHSNLVESTPSSRHDDSKELLLPQEERWRDRQSLLDSHGYILRPRLRPGWIPSWKTNSLPIYDCEDSIPLPWTQEIVDAIRKTDKKLVCVKHVEKDSKECVVRSVVLSKYLTDDGQDRFVPLLDTFDDPINNAMCYHVVPFLRKMYEPPFEIVSEVIDFVDQVLEGLTFLHENGIALRNISREHIMMDATALYPKGFHPIARLFLPDYSTLASPSSRSTTIVKYYFVDYSKAVILSPKETRLVQDTVDVDFKDRPPELDKSQPYDPFKLDIFLLGSVLHNEFHKIYSNLDFILPLTNAMMTCEPDSRPDSAQAQRIWVSILKDLSFVKRMWRLRNRDEVMVEKVVYDTSSLVHTGVQFSKKILGRM